MDPHSVPIHNALTRKILIGGVTRRVAILNGTITAALGIGFQAWWVLPVGAIFHAVAALLTKWDEHFFDVLFRHIRQKGFYDV